MRSASRARARQQTEGSSSQGLPSASSAAGRASSSSQKGAVWDYPKRSASTDAGRVYIEAVLDRYLWLPGTPTRTSRHDRRLARMLYERGVLLAVVQVALLVGAARRSFRAADAPPLPPIRTLHYFLPIIEEILDSPLAPGYAGHLESKLQPLADTKGGEERRSPVTRHEFR